MDFTKLARYSGFLGALVAAVVIVVTTGDITTASGIVAASLSSVAALK